MQSSAKVKVNFVDIHENKYLFFFVVFICYTFHFFKCVASAIELFAAVLKWTQLWVSTVKTRVQISNPSESYSTCVRTVYRLKKVHSSELLGHASRAVTSASTFLVTPGRAPLLYKIDSAAASAAGILIIFKRCANRQFYFLTK